MLKITTIIAFLLLIPYLILGGFLVYFLYGMESCHSIWYYNIDLDDLGINEHTLAMIDSHYQNTTIIPDRKVDVGAGESIYAEFETTTEEGEEDVTGALADWLDINNLRLPSNVITNRPWTAHQRPTETLEEKEEDEQSPAVESESKTELSPTNDKTKRRRKIKSSKRHRSEKTNKGHHTEDTNRDLRVEKKKSRKAHKTGETGEMDKIDNVDNIDDTIPGEVDEPMPTPLRFGSQNYCTTPYHGMLCMLGTVLMGLSKYIVNNLQVLPKLIPRNFEFRNFRHCNVSRLAWCEDTPCQVSAYDYKHNRHINTPRGRGRTPIWVHSNACSLIVSYCVLLASASLPSSWGIIVSPDHAMHSIKYIFITVPHRDSRLLDTVQGH